jgi:DNA-binding transcriptional MocR family regulator
VYYYTDTLSDGGMFDRIDPRSPTPLYAQIAGRLRVAVAAGELRAGDALPSVRALASRLRINPATVAQAYRELEQDGTVEMRQGAGHSSPASQPNESAEIAPPRPGGSCRRCSRRELVSESLPTS